MIFVHILLHLCTYFWSLFMIRFFDYGQRQEELQEGSKAVFIQYLSLCIWGCFLLGSDGPIVFS